MNKNLMKRDESMFESISIDEFAEKIEEENVALIDVREKSQFDEGHIPNAFSIPLGEISDRIDELDKKEKYYVICHAGVRSVQASEYLTANGFNVTNVTGGMSAWTGTTA